MSQHKEKRTLRPDNDDDDEDESEEREEPNDFLDDEAQEDNDDEVEAPVTERDRRMIEEARKQYGHENQARRMMRERLENSQDYVKHLDEVVERGEPMQAIDEDEDVIDLEKRLPEWDPDKNYPIYAVRCRPKKEIIIAQKIMFLWAKEKTRMMHIHSVYIPEEKKGILYIEAMNKRKLCDAVEGIRDIYINSCTELSSKQRAELLVSRTPENIAPNTYVRIKTGMYKGDFGIVVKQDGRDMKRVQVKLVPRFDIAEFQRVAHKKDKGEDGGDQSDDDDDGERKRAPKRILHLTKQLFNPNELGISDYVNEEEDDLGRVIVKFHGRTFCDGFIYKYFKNTQVQVQNVIPTDEELITFNTNNEMEAKGMIRATRYRTFKVGDKVIVDDETNKLNGKKAIVRKILKGNDVVISFTTQERGSKVKNEEFELIPDTSLRILFEVGDRVKVIGGKYKDQTGIIESISGEDIFIVTDETRSTIQVAEIDVENTTDVGREVTELGGYKVQDFVQLPGGAGMVLEVLANTNELLVLNDNNRIEKINPVAIQGVLTERRDLRCKDSERNFVSIGDKVTIVHGTYQDRSAIIKHIYKYTKVFLQCEGVIENGSYIVLSSRDIKGAHSIKAIRNERGRERDRERERDSGMNRYPSETQTMSKDNSEVGKIVVITSGPYKGYKGKVLSQQDDMYRIELRANQKIIKIESNKTKAFQNMTEEAEYGMATPAAHFPMTPAVGGSMVAPTPFTRGEVAATPMNHYSSYPLRTPG